MRITEPPTGWRVVKPTDGDGGTVFRRDVCGRPPRQGTDTRDWNEVQRAHLKAMTPARLKQVASELGVSTNSLQTVGVGWRTRDKCFTFPERNSLGEVIGLNRRYDDGSKKAIKGGRRGISIPGNLDQTSGEVLVVEGPTDVAACVTLGLPAVGRYSARGAKFLADLLGEREVLIVGENDRKPDGSWPGRDGAKSVAQQLATKWGRSVSWCLPPEGTKDVRDWLRKQSVDLADPEACKATGQRLSAALRTAAAEIVPDSDTSSEHPYLATARGLVYVKQVDDSDVDVRLTNFVATIKADVAFDDGAEITHTLEIEAKAGGKTRTFTIPAARFAGLTWVIENLGPQALVYPGATLRDHTRAAIQLLSTSVTTQTVYGHTGWRKIDAHWIYLHAGGGIGTNGTIGPSSTTYITLPSAIQPLFLRVPENNAELRKAIESELTFLTVAPDHISVPLLSAVYRVVLGGVDFAIHLAGPTGAGKSELAALAQQHFGAGFDARHLPGSWSSTANAMEALAFSAKDALLIVDDFSPAGGSHDVARLHAQADRLLRAQGNQLGRHRLRPDGTLRPVKAPRGLIVSTGEDVPRGHSLTARLFVVELGPSDLRWNVLTE